nr:pentapeptide repeat-containing protein [Kineosporia mesophila]
MTDCTFTALRSENSRLTRVAFRGCRLMGATFEDCTLDHVLFDSCRLDYATFTRVRAAGPVIFTNCRLTEARFDACTLEKAAIENCELPEAEFGPGRYRHLDLRGSDLSRVIGASRLSGAIISPDQEHQLAQALITALDLTVADDA